MAGRWSKPAPGYQFDGRQRMAFEFMLRKIAEFAETDAEGIVHFSNYFRYMEMTEHAFLRSLGFSVHHRDPKQRVGWPRVSVECEYKQPIRFEDEVEVHLLVQEKKPKSLSYRFILRKVIDGKAAEVLALGKSTAVCIGFAADGSILGAIPIPAPLAAKIEVAPPELLRE